MNEKLTILLLVLLLSSSAVKSQIQILPDWIHTETHGAGQNGRLTVDSITGLVYWTLSEENNAITIPQAELHVFDQLGNDLTPLNPDLFALYNSNADLQRESIEDPRMNNDTLLISIFDLLDPNSDRSTLTEWAASGPLRTVTFFGRNNTSETKELWSDDQGIIVLLEQAQPYVLSFNNGWLPVWQHIATNQEHAIAASADKVFLARLPEVRVFDRSSGDSLFQFSVGNTPLANAGVLTVINNAIYHAYVLDSTMYMGSTDLLGNSLWDNSIQLGNDFIANEIIVDGLGGVWIGASLDPDINLQHADGGRLVAVDPTGTIVQQYSFGSTMTDIAYTNGTLYACGKLDSASTTSYIIAALLGIPTGVGMQERTMGDVFLFPQPAKEKVTVQWTATPGESYTIVLRDAFGRMVATDNSVGTNGLYQMDLAGYASGIYVVGVLGNRGGFFTKTMVVR